MFRFGLILRDARLDPALSGIRGAIPSSRSPSQWDLSNSSGVENGQADTQHDLNVTSLRPGAETYLLTALLESTYIVIRPNDLCRSFGDQQYRCQALVQRTGSGISQDSDYGEISSGASGVVSYLGQAQAKAVLSPIVSNCVD